MAFFGFGLGAQRTTEQGIRMLSLSQQNELALALATAQTEADRNQIIANKLVEFANADKASEKAATFKLYIATGSVAIVLVFGLLIYWKKR